MGKIGFYTCPSHPQIQATWPAQCPLCRHVLEEAQPSAATPLGAASAVDKDKRDGDEAGETQPREEEVEEQYGQQGYYPYYPPDNGYYSYNFPYGYAYGGYNNYAGRPYYNPSYGYYNPNTGFYFNPNTGYYYNPDTGQGYYAQNYNPNYTYPYYGYTSPGYPYYYPDEQARERAERERREHEGRVKHDRR